LMNLWRKFGLSVVPPHSKKNVRLNFWNREFLRKTFFSLSLELYLERDNYISVIV